MTGTLNVLPSSPPRHDDDAEADGEYADDGDADTSADADNATDDDYIGGMPQLEVQGVSVYIR